MQGCEDAPETAEHAADGRKEAISQALQSLQTLTADRDSCIANCRMLENITLKSSGSQARLLKADGAKTLTMIMAAHLKDAEVQMVVCRTLQHLASAVSANGPGILAQAGACAAARCAMEAHENDADVQQAACHAIELMAFGGPEPRSQAIIDGCPEAILQALKKFRDKAFVIQACMASLQALIEDVECQQRLVKAGALTVVITALGDCKDNAEVTYWGQLLINGLCNGNAELRQEAVRKCHFQKIELDFGS